MASGFFWKSESLASGHQLTRTTSIPSRVTGIRTWLLAKYPRNTSKFIGISRSVIVLIPQLTRTEAQSSLLDVIEVNVFKKGQRANWINHSRDTSSPRLRAIGKPLRKRLFRIVAHGY